MRDYAKVEPKMWHGQTMKALRKEPKALVVAMYLMTSPSSNMLGLFAQPVMYMAYETGLGIEGASKGLQVCCSAGFCSYDEASEFVWVHEMARYQIAQELKASDLRCKGIQKEYEALPDNPFLGAFFDRYADAFHLSKRRGEQGATQAPSKPLRSQEQEQEQEQEQDPPPVGGGAPRKRSAAPPAVARPDDVAEQTWADWLTLRKAKKAPVTETVVANARRESEKAGMPLDAFLQVWCLRGSQGLLAEWLKPHERQVASRVSFAEADAQRARDRADAWMGRPRRAAPIDITEPGGPALELLP